MPRLIVLLAITPLPLASAADWPCYRGPSHNGVSTDPILSSFPSEGPRQIWKVSLGAGFSSFAVRGGKAFTQVRRIVDEQDREVCVALSITNGTELWATPVDIASYPDGGTGEDDGPRSTPSVDGDWVYVLSSYLKLTKLNATNGGVSWQRDLVALYEGQVIPWQNAASPLLEGDLIFLNCNSPSNCLLALRKSDGSLAWQRGADALTHATPVPATIEGVRQVIFFTQSGLVAVAPGSGDELWRYPFDFSTSSAASPVADGSIVYCSAGYGCGSAAVQISRVAHQFTVTELWRNTLQNYWSTPVCTGGFLYGLFGNYSSAALKCIELVTGREMWSEPSFGSGGILLVDGKLLVTDKAGDVVLVDAYPLAYSKLDRFGAVRGKCWNSPAVCDGRLYARSATNAVCLNLASETPALAQSLERISDDRLCLRISSSDGIPLDSNRFARVEVHSSTNLLTPPAGWPSITNALALTNGAIQVILKQQACEQYFIGVEQP